MSLQLKFRYFRYTAQLIFSLSSVLTLTACDETNSFDPKIIVEITTPPNDQLFLIPIGEQDVDITFQGNAIDRDEGPLTNTSLEWWSKISTQADSTFERFGVGGNVSALFTDGKYTIRLIATNGEGLERFDSILLEVDSAS